MRRLLLLSLLLVNCISHAQDAFFTDYRSSLLLVNPAFAGSQARGRAEAGYRLQWPDLSGTYATYHFSYDQYCRAGGIGISYLHDDPAHGASKADRVDLVYAPYFAFKKDSTEKGKFVLQPGISMAYLRNAIDPSKFSYNSQLIAPAGPAVGETFRLTSRSSLDISAGLLCYTKRIVAGLAVFHITEPDQGFNGPAPLPMRFVYHISGMIGKTDDSIPHFRIIPSLVYMKQQDAQLLSMQVTASYSHYSLGIGYRNLDAWIFSAGFTTGQFRIAYLYEATDPNSALKATGGAHEIHLQYFFWEERWKNSRTNLRLYN